MGVSYPPFHTPSLCQFLPPFAGRGIFVILDFPGLINCVSNLYLLASRLNCLIHLEFFTRGKEENRGLY